MSASGSVAGERASPQPSRRGSLFAAARTLSIARKFARNFKTRRESCLTDVSSKYSQPVVRMENSYRIEPDKVFQPSMIETSLNEMLERHLKDVPRYDAHLAGEQTLRISQSAQQIVRRLKIPRYKFVCHVLLGENRDQDIALASRCVWNETLDTYATVTFCKRDLFCAITVFAIYFD